MILQIQFSLFSLFYILHLLEIINYANALIMKFSMNFNDLLPNRYTPFDSVYN